MKRPLFLAFAIFIIGTFINAEPIPSDNKLYIMEWSEVDELTTILAEKCKKESSEWKGIIIVSRGGMVPAGILAQKLSLKNNRIICIASYSGKEKSDIKVIYMPNDITDGGKNWLIVDDLVDSGATFRFLKSHFPNAFYVTLIAKPKGLDAVNFAPKEYPQDTWLSFPWER